MCVVCSAHRPCFDRPNNWKNQESKHPNTLSSYETKSDVTTCKCWGQERHSWWNQQITFVVLPYPVQTVQRHSILRVSIEHLDEILCLHVTTSSTEILYHELHPYEISNTVYWEDCKENVNIVFRYYLLVGLWDITGSWTFSLVVDWTPAPSIYTAYLFIAQKFCMPVCQWIKSRIFFCT
jgi:hypothetical protein